MKGLQAIAWLAAGLSAAACHKDAPPCDPPTNFGCASTLQCETVEGTSPQCLPPVVLSGTVSDSEEPRAIGNARVLVLDPDGTPLQPAVTTRNDGVYAVRIASPRNADLTPTAQTVTVRVEAPGYQHFPGGFRPAVPINTNVAALTAEGDEYLVTAPTIGLIQQGGGTGSLSGQVELPSTNEQIIVVAEPSQGFTGPAGYSSMADASGFYQISSLPPDTYTLSAYAKGENYVTVPVSVDVGQQAGSDLKLGGASTSHVTGKVTGAGSATTVELAVASTWNPVTTQRDVPAGLSATLDATGLFILDGVPEGTYVLLPSLENDGLVRDPSAATPLAQVIVVAGQDTAVPDPQPLVPAIALQGPLAQGVTVVSSAPTFTWQDTANEASYHLVVTDAIGNSVWTDDEPMHAGDAPMVPYTGPLIKGMFYRFQVQARDSLQAPITTSEDLLGVFVLPAQ